jgi:hypothetical protein
MDREEIIRMAREAGLAYGSDENPLGSVTRFAALVAEHEREACAKFIEHDYVRQFERPWRDDLSAAIRARGKK